jgi:uncharacterized protein involved in outer membrane biogenesis
MKFIFKWLFRLCFAIVAFVIVAVIVLLLSYNSILRSMLERQIHAQTGMDAEIGRLNVGLISPTVEIKDFTLHNSPKFGGAPFLDIREIHLEYDRAALARHEIHITLLRLDLGELDIVKNEAGRTNVFLPAANLQSTNSPAATSFADFQRQRGFKFTGIDVLNVSVGKLKYIDLKDPRNDRERDINLEDCVIKDVKTPTDLAGLAVLIALRSGDFFGPLINSKP